jgi:hypothetical protein
MLIMSPVTNAAMAAATKIHGRRRRGRWWTTPNPMASTVARPIPAT